MCIYEKLKKAKLEVFDLVPQENTIQLVNVKSETKQQHMLIIDKPSIQECVISCNVYECHNIKDDVFRKSSFSINICYKNKCMSTIERQIENDKIIWKEKVSSVFQIEKQ